MAVRMKVLKGVTASPGIAKGTACLYSDKAIDRVMHYTIDSSRVDSEISRLDEALDKAKDMMRQMIDASSKMLDNRASGIFSAHLAMLEDPVLYKEIVDLIKTKRINAEHAVDDAFEGYIKTFQLSDLHFAELAHDTMDVKNRILFSFSGLSGKFECPTDDRQSVVIVSKRLTPSMVLSIPRKNILAFVTEEGGFTTHATILARSFDTPVIFGIGVEDNIGCGDSVIIDGTSGKVFIEPDEETDRFYSEKIESIKKKMGVCRIRTHEAPHTKKGLRIKLKANIILPGEVGLLKDIEYDGVGLLRTEFLFLNREAPPSEDEQFKMYNRICEDAEGREVTLRLLDIGGDKMPMYLHLPPQDNPDLGIRGARALDYFYDIYLSQIKAALRASACGKLRILFPMVSDLNDVNTFKALADKARSGLKKEKKDFNKDAKEGIMIETPAAAVMSDILLKNVDFVNIGSNDLLQYTLAASRGNMAVEKRYHVLHPALVKLMEEIIRAGKAHKKEVCLCGEIANFEEFYPFFLSLGLRSFSVAATRFEHIKCELMHLKRPERSMAQEMYRAVTIEEIDKIFGR